MNAQGQNSTGLVKPEVLVQPIPFPMPTIRQAVLKKITLQLNPDKIIQKSALETDNGNVYEIGRILKDAIYGHVYHAVLTQRIQIPDLSGNENKYVNSQTNNGNKGFGPADVTGVTYSRTNPLQQVAIKVYSKQRIREYRGRTQEDPIKELSSMQYLEEHPSIMSQLECVEDRDNIYSIMPFCDGGELYDIIEAKGAMSESMARYYFVQILQGFSYLQSRGVAHRDMSLENIMFDASGRCYIIDMGMCLRLPLPSCTQPTASSSSGSGGLQTTQEQQYAELNRVYQQQLHHMSGHVNSSSSSSVIPLMSSQSISSLPPPPPPPEENDMDMDSSSDSLSMSPKQHDRKTDFRGRDQPHQERHQSLCAAPVSSVVSIKIPCQGVCGKRNYIAPEVLDNSAYFEPFCVDIWALGIVLFIMLTGVPPVDTATAVDQRYRLICAGFLSNMLEQWGIKLSDEAVDLIKRILRPTPSDRLTLAEIMEHPWTRKVDGIPVVP